jgi:hypothetical protein
MRSLPLAVLGAMQRAHPAITELFFYWTGVPHLAGVTFTFQNNEKNELPFSMVILPAHTTTAESQNAIGDLLGFDEDASERHQSNIVLPYLSQANTNFWEFCAKRQHELETPLEFWWYLLVLRSGSPERATSLVLNHLGVYDIFSRRAILSIQNPSIKASARTAKELLVDGAYLRATSVTIQDTAKAIQIPINPSIIKSIMLLAYLQDDT